MPMMRNRGDAPPPEKPPAMSKAVMSVLDDAVQSVKKSMQSQQKPKGPQPASPPTTGVRG